MTPPSPAPVTDAFGTRLDPAALGRELRRLAGPAAWLRLRDDGLRLRLPASSGAQARTVAWLRSVFSPFLPLQVEGVSAEGPPAPEPAFADERTRPVLKVALCELPSGGDLSPAIDALLRRLGPAQAPRSAAAPAPTHAGPVPEGGPARAWQAVVAALPRFGFDPQASFCRFFAGWRGGDAVQEGGRSEGACACAAPAFLMWRRPGGRHGVREALLLAASFHPRALNWLAAALRGPASAPEGFEVLLDGLEWAVARRPTVAAEDPRRPGLPILVDPERCSACALCAQVCPTGYLGDRGAPASPDPSGCIQCYDCVEACPEDALRPGYGEASAMLGSAAARRPLWLSRLRGAPGPALPAPFPPSYLLPKPDAPARPRRVLGLAVTTAQEHAAALVEDGKLVGAVEEERFSRVRHHGWKPEGRPGATLTSDPTLCVEEAFCRRSIAALLGSRGLTLDDMDAIALNGLPARYRRAYSAVESGRPIPVLRSGRLVSVPHHLCHAASAYTCSGLETAWVLTVDGRGDRETAALFQGHRGRLTQAGEILALSDRSIGGVYETVTRLLGFGAHGQGSVMALAAFGQPRFDFDRFLSVRSWSDVSLDDSGVGEAFASLARRPGAPIEQDHRDLAASLQAALEQALLNLLRSGGVPRGAEGICLAGGVALNCRTNQLIWETFRPRSMFAQPAANDAGTAIGAAFAALGPELPWGPQAALEHACLGPAYSEAEIESVLERSGLAFQRAGDPAGEAAARLARGEVVAWFQGRMEVGPRALGARSLLADPRRPEMKERLNRVKGREPWRPFAPSLLAGHEMAWFENACDSRFMLFTPRLKPERARQVPAVLHADGTSRPQSVHRRHQPLYHALLEAFRGLTGVPMVLNTSFNRRDEPIVCTPRDAVECFLAMWEVDALVIGPFVAARSGPGAPECGASADSAARLRSGRRLLLRLSAACDLDCGHCTMRDLQGRPDRSPAGARKALLEGRRAGCDELVLMRGEPLRWPGLPALLREARRLGYRYAQAQTNARALSSLPYARELRAAGLDACEAMLLAAHEDLHGPLSGAPGAFREVVAGLRNAVRAGLSLMVHVPVLAGNREELPRIVSLARAVGARAVQFGFPRPVELRDGVQSAPLLRLSDASPAIRKASRLAARLGLAVSTEGVPLCHLDQEFRSIPDAREDWSRFRVDDLSGLQASWQGARGSSRPEPPVCRACRYRDGCPRTWASYLALFGSSEFQPEPEAACVP